MVLTGRETGVVDTWDWSYQMKEPAATNKISSLPVTSIKVRRLANFWQISLYLTDDAIAKLYAP